MNFLEKIKEIKIMEVAQRKKEFPFSKIKKRLKKGNHAFLKAIRHGQNHPAIIAEFKRGSPSRGNINKKASLKEFIQLYDQYADAISILTEETHFSGKIGDIKEARKHTKKPILRKDFIIDEYQIYEARKYGADAILLIGGFLKAKEMNQFLKVADALGMDCLTEFFDNESFHEVMKSNAKIIGINNRNLKTMKEDLGKTKKYFSLIPKARRKASIIVSESAIFSREDVDKVRHYANAMLVGTSIMSSPFPKGKIKELAGKPLVKVCGITNVKDAKEAVNLGADVIGINFYKKSPRFVVPEKAIKLAEAVKGKALVAGVFVNEKKGKINGILKKVRLNIIQLSGKEKPGEEKGFSVPVIKAIHIDGKHSIDLAGKYSSQFIMADSSANGLFGGTGKKVNKKFVDVKKLGKKQLVFSGGLSEKNVKGIINEFRPFMVDVCSSVEKSPGVKSRGKMKNFIESAGGKV